MPFVCSRAALVFVLYARLSDCEHDHSQTKQAKKLKFPKFVQKPLLILLMAKILQRVLRLIQTKLIMSFEKLGVRKINK